MFDHDAHGEQGGGQHDDHAVNNRIEQIVLSAVVEAWNNICHERGVQTGASAVDIYVALVENTTATTAGFVWIDTVTGQQWAQTPGSLQTLARNRVPWDTATAVSVRRGRGETIVFVLTQVGPVTAYWSNRTLLTMPVAATLCTLCEYGRRLA
ncbi:unnamed protein product [Sphagnum balticum]